MGREGENFLKRGEIDGERREKEKLKESERGERKTTLLLIAFSAQETKFRNGN